MFYLDKANNQIEYSTPIRNSAWICCWGGVIALFYYPMQGIGLILYGGFLLYWVLANENIAVTRGMNEKLSEIAAYLDDMRGKDLARK